MKKILLTMTVLVALISTALAADTVTVNPASGVALINSTNTASSAATFGTATNGIWPTYILPNVSVTNVTRIPRDPAAKDLALQFTVGTTGTTNSGAVVIQFGRNVQGGNPTNAIGTGLNIEWIGTMTLTVTTNTTGPYTQCTNWWGGTAITPAGAIGDTYIGWITTPTTLTLTNYSVYVNSK